MLTRLLNVALWIDTAFSRTGDPLTAEYRLLQRHFVLSAAAMALALLLSVLFASMLDSIHAVLREILSAVGIGFLALALASLIWFAWTSYALWRWENERN